jgi:hypothetical protein
MGVDASHESKLVKVKVSDVFPCRYRSLASILAFYTLERMATVARD